MKICEGLHQIKINFHVTPQIERYVYVYILTGEHCYLIDTGVHGSEKKIEDYLHQIGYQIEDVHGIFLTHAHPDHMGSAYAIQKQSGCPIYASQAEKEWIENIDKQFKDRPIPNFYSLLQNSVDVDFVIEKEMEIELEEKLFMRILLTPGHSHGSLSFLVNHHILFTGDAIAVIGDIPIYTNVYQSLETLNQFLTIPSIDYYCPAWDTVYPQEVGQEKIRQAIHLIQSIDECVQKIMNHYPLLSHDRLFELVCYQMKMESFTQNPLFKKTILCHI